MKKNNFIKSIFLTLALFGSFNFAFAQVTLKDDLKPTYAPGTIVKKSEDSNRAPATYGNFVLQILAGGLIYVAAPVAVIVLAVAGLFYVTSASNPKNADKAKEAVKWAIIGLLVIIFSWVIVRGIIEQTLKLNESGNSNTKIEEQNTQNTTSTNTEGGKPSTPKQE